MSTEMVKSSTSSGRSSFISDDGDYKMAQYPVVKKKLDTTLQPSSGGRVSGKEMAQKVKNKNPKH